jgi:hypothetical protein
VGQPFRAAAGLIVDPKGRGSEGRYPQSSAAAGCGNLGPLIGVLVWQQRRRAWLPDI